MNEKKFQDVAVAVLPALAFLMESILISNVRFWPASGEFESTNTPALVLLTTTTGISLPLTELTK